MANNQTPKNVISYPCRTHPFQNNGTKPESWLT
jgi:hypothetical protein